MTSQQSMGEWSPGLNDTQTLRDAYEYMPGDDASKVPWYVRLLENPKSRLALPGAVDLFGHDCIHILLGRGMYAQDEAFVIGVTMGASGELSAGQHELYKLWSQLVYRGPYRFSRVDLLVLDIAVEFARRQNIRPLHRVAWKTVLDRPLGELRASLGIDVDSLMSVFDIERRLLSASAATQRLPTARTTSADTVAPNG